MRRVRQKEANLRELLLQHVAFKRLIDRNRKNEDKEGPPKYVNWNKLTKIFKIILLNVEICFNEIIRNF